MPLLVFILAQEANHLPLDSLKGANPLHSEGANTFHSEGVNLFQSEAGNHLLSGGFHFEAWMAAHLG